MKRLNKNILIGILLGSIIGTISVYATTHYQSEQILYTKNGKQMTTTAFLNDIYSLIDKGDAKASDVLVGKTVVVKGKKITGTKTLEDFVNIVPTQLSDSAFSKHYDLDNKTNDQSYNIDLHEYSSSCTQLTSNNIAVENYDYATSASSNGTANYSWTYTSNTCILKIRVWTSFPNVGKQDFKIKIFTLTSK